jgi:hypothetical protein
MHFRVQESSNSLCNAMCNRMCNAGDLAGSFAVASRPCCLIRKSQAARDFYVLQCLFCFKQSDSCVVSDLVDFRMNINKGENHVRVSILNCVQCILCVSTRVYP